MLGRAHGIEVARRVQRFAGRTHRARKPPRPFSVRPIELAYRAQLLSILGAAKKLVDDLLVSRLPQIQAQVPGIRKDDWSDEVNRALGDVRARFAGLNQLRGQHRTAKDAYRSAAEGVAREVARRNLESIRAQVRAAAGVDVFLGDAGVSSQVGAFAAENVSLISSIPEDYFRQVEGIVMRNFRAGRRAEDFQQEIEDRFGVAESRAALIARDQVSKLNGDLTRVRQTSLGIEHYIWRTSQDERVRDSHAALEGKKIAWDDPPEVGHPGEDYNCRCNAEPVIEELGSEE